MASSDDEDMADLFSFGSGENATAQSSFQGVSAAASDDTTSGINATSSLDDAAVSAAPYRSNSDDEFLDLLEDSPELLSGPTGLGGGDEDASHDAETQEILAWLDEESPTVVESSSTSAGASSPQSTKSEQQEEEAEHDEAKKKPVSSPVKKPEPPPAETVVALPPVFKSLTGALASSQATVGQIRHLAADHLEEITNVNRPDLFCRLLTGKSLQHTNTKSSLADAFYSWKISEARKDEIAPAWMQLTCESLAERVAESLEKTHATHRDKEDCRQDLLDVLQYHWRGLPKPATSTNDDEGDNGGGGDDKRDWFIPPVAATILGFSVPAPAASVLLSQVIGQHMPVLALQSTERWEAAKGLHQHLYWLACYHLPLLVFHLDRYWPGWCAPRVPQHDDTSANEAATVQARHLEERGLVPPSWLVSLLAGDSSFLPVAWMGQIWDWILTSPTRNVPFFLTLAVLEKASDDLIVLMGDELKRGHIKAFEFDESTEWLETWWDSAQALQSATPKSVLEQLEKAEDEAVQQAVTRRQEKAEAELAARLKAEQEAHQEEQERKAEEARRRLTRARLVVFYRKHAPDKEGNIDQILQKYADNLEVLDAKLFRKYGESFNPAIKEKKSRAVQPNKLLATMNQGLKRNSSKTVEDDPASPPEQIEAPAASKTEQVSVLVKAEEVLPVLCWSKEAAAIRGANRRGRPGASTVPLKFFLVDSRSEDAAEEQGRFPTAVSLSPETMLDPERLQKSEEQFESLRGAVHIVVMGEGFSAIPKLYDQKLSSQLEEAMKQDDSRTNICALFFFKKGFPFVSILDGGFAAAHSWLVREGPSYHLEASSVLIDYDAEKSLFGQMERLRNASATEKASRAMQNLMEKSLVAMTLQARQLEKLASDMEQGKNRFGMGFLTNRARSAGQTTQRSNSNDENAGPRFANPFAHKSKENPTATENPRFGNMFARQKSTDDNAEATASSGDSNTGPVPFRNPFGRKQADESEDTPAATETVATAGPIPFRNPFARKQAQEAEQGQSDSAGTTKPSVEATGEADADVKPAISNPFKGFGAAINNTVNRNNDGATTETSTSTGDSKPAMANPFKGFGAALNNTMNRNPEASASEAAGLVKPSSEGDTEESKVGTTAGDKRNMFSGIGSAFQNVAKAGEDKGNPPQAQGGPAGVPNMLKRNPFRGFGGGGPKKAPEENKKGGFGFGRAPFTRVRPAGSKDQGDSQVGTNEESIAFG